jgi:hypothetical protein
MKGQPDLGESLVARGEIHYRGRVIVDPLGKDLERLLIGPEDGVDRAPFGVSRDEVGHMLVGVIDEPTDKEAGSAWMFLFPPEQLPSRVRVTPNPVVEGSARVWEMASPAGSLGLRSCHCRNRSNQQHVKGGGLHVSILPSRSVFLSAFGVERWSELRQQGRHLPMRMDEQGGLLAWLIGGLPIRIRVREKVPLAWISFQLRSREISVMNEGTYHARP